MARVEKTCTGCGEVKPLSEFQKYWNSQRETHYHQSQCRPCRNSGRRVTEPRRSDHPDLVKRREKYATDAAYRRKLLDGQYKSKYGITLDERDARLASQGGVCAACGSPEPGTKGWCTDHDHSCCPKDRTCGQCIRGIVCSGCNLALGHVGDSVERLAALIDYLTLAGMSPGGDPNMSANVSRMIPV